VVARWSRRETMEEIVEAGLRSIPGSASIC